MPQEVITPKIRGFICLNAHPRGCAKNVERQFDYVQKKLTPISTGKNVLVLGASTGYGLASRIVVAAGWQAKTLGVFLERAPEGNKPGSAGFYNTTAFHRQAQSLGLWAKSINADAFSDETRKQTMEIIRQEMGKIDLVVYSLASPRRTHPRTGQVHNSCLKPVGQAYQSKSIDLSSGKVVDVTIEPATDKEIADTITVMGGEDWQFWIDALLENDLLARGARTLSYSYIGPKQTWAIYRNGTIGIAKEDLEKRAREMDEKLKNQIGGHAWVSVNKGLVTQASSAIPVVPLYISILYKVMKAKNIQEGCIEQITRLFSNHLNPGKEPVLDEMQRIRLDDWEMREDVQTETAALWGKITTENLLELSDYAGFKKEFRNLFGFEVEGIDYNQPVEILETL